MSILTTLILVFCFASVSAFALLIGRRIVPDDDDRAEARLERVSAVAGADGEATRPDVQGSVADRLLKPMLRRWTAFVARRLPAAARDAARRRLLMAGSPLGLQAGEFLAIRAALTVLFPVILLVLGLVGSGGSLGKTVLLSVLVGALGSLIPEMWVKGKADARQREMTRTLPDMVDLLTVSVEAGLGFDAALSRVSAKSEGPLAWEFERVLQEIRVGKARRTAMRELTQRTTSEDLIAFLVSVIQADQLGVSIGNVLRVQSAEMRRKRRQRAEETAMKAPIKMLFPMVIFIFPGLFIVLLGPAVIQVIEMFTGGGPL